MIFSYFSRSGSAATGASDGHRTKHSSATGRNLILFGVIVPLSLHAVWALDKDSSVAA